ncbi:hypothetical protein [Nocardia cyriacigeorgica]|uniref:hypothetical protein n=1 Tax=Nocardia cyriacigeorgica TaxID=135487 RepID=UPI0020176F4F|nr:hypothetical protein [Nocardia cyriacigeorgica]
MKPRALGYLRADRSVPNQLRDEVQIRSLATRYGYSLCKTIVFTASTPDPIQQLIEAVRRADAEAVFIPNVMHFDGLVPVELVAVADVVTVRPEETFARWATGEVHGLDGVSIKRPEP